MSLLEVVTFSSRERVPANTAKIEDDGSLSLLDGDVLVATFLPHTWRWFHKIPTEPVGETPTDE